MLPEARTHQRRSMESPHVLFLSATPEFTSIPIVQQHHSHEAQIQFINVNQPYTGNTRGYRDIQNYHDTSFDYSDMFPVAAIGREMQSPPDDRKANLIQLDVAHEMLNQM